MLTIDTLCYQSKLRYVNAGEKFAFSILTLLACVVGRSATASCVVLLVTGILTVYKGGIPATRYLQYMAAPLSFLILGTLAIVLHISKTPLDLFAVPVGSFYLTGSRASMGYALQLVLTAFAAVSCLYFLSFSTPITDILNVLRRLHCPRLLLELMLLIYRYIFVLLEIASAIHISQCSRLGNRDYKTALKSFGALISALFIRAMKKSGALYDAMESRCYDGTIRVLDENYPPKAMEIFWIVLFEGLLFLFIFLRKLGTL